jgi:hypothetical protein
LERFRSGDTSVTHALDFGPTFEENGRFRRDFDAERCRVVDGGGLEKLIAPFVEFAIFPIKSARHGG